MLGLDTGRGAVLSACGQYRYRLWRDWGTGGTCVFLMLNPSTADADKDDATIRKCTGFAKRWGYGGIEVVNLAAWRATDPRELLHVPHPVSESFQPQRNFVFIQNAINNGKIVVAAWGVPGGTMPHSFEFMETLRNHWPGKLRVLGFNKDGTPKHPLMVPYAQPPVMVVQ